MDRRVALITGASSGFGLLSTVELARKGFHVVATMRELARRTRLEEAVAAAGLTGQVSIHRLDVAEPATHAAIVAEIVAELGRIDVLVNNAGYALAGFAEDVSLDELRRQFETNFLAQSR